MHYISALFNEIWLVSFYFSVSTETLAFTFAYILLAHASI